MTICNRTTKQTFPYTARELLVAHIFMSVEFPLPSSSLTEGS